VNHLTELAARVYGVLMAHAGARDDHRGLEEFVDTWPHRSTEYRFMGSLGWGGKVWFDRGRVYVTCYPEDRTPDRDAVIQKTNERLTALTDQRANDE
jgi:hypothetical protein